MPKVGSRLQIAGYILISVTILTFFFFTIKYAQNIPYNDDYPTIIGFLADKEKAHTAGEIFRLYFQPYGEHRIFFVRLFSSMQMLFFQRLNFATLAFVGNLAFLVSYLFLLRSVKISKDQKAFFLAPTAFFLFHLQSWSNNIWAMASVSNTLVFCWVLLSLYYFFRPEQNKSGFIAALFFALLATYTVGNGVFVLFAAAFTFFCLKQFWEGSISLVLFLLLFAINNHTAGGTITSRIMHQGVGKIIGMFVVFLGSNFFHPSYIKVAVAAGIAFVGYFLFIFIVKRYYVVNPTVFAVFIFLFITAAGVATQREILDIYTVAPSRYRVYGSLLIAISYISFIELSAGKGIQKLATWVILPISVLFFTAGMFAGTGKMRNRYQLNRSYSFLLQHHIFLDPYLDSMYQIAVNNQYIRENPIPIGSLVLPRDPSSPVSIGKSAPNGIYAIDTILSKQNFIVMKGWAGLTDNQNTLNSTHIILHSRSRKVYRTNFIEVFAFINNKDMLRYATCGFVAVLPEEEYYGADSVSVAISRELTERNLIPVYTFKPAR